MAKKRSMIVTGTDTEVGKTVVTGGLAYYFKTLGLKVCIQKWVSTGDGELKVSSDLLRSLYFMEHGTHETASLKTEDLLLRYNDNISKMNPYSFTYPAAPNLSASLSGTSIEVRKIKNAYYDLRDGNDVLIIEGVGGLFVPLNDDTLLIDLIKELDIPVVLVSKNSLGTINHTLLSVETLKTRDIHIMGIIMNNYFHEEELIRESNIKTIKNFADVEILGSIGNSNNSKSFVSEMIAIGEKIQAEMENE